LVVFQVEGAGKLVALFFGELGLGREAIAEILKAPLEHGNFLFEKDFEGSFLSQLVGFSGQSLLLVEQLSDLLVLSVHNL